MTDEEGKSIEDLSEFFEYAQDMINDMEYERPVDVTIYQNNIDSYRTLLNLLSKLKTENEKLEKENDELRNHVHYKKCLACGNEFKAKRKDAKYCVYCSKFMNNRNYYMNLTEEQKAKRREQAKLSMRKLRKERKNTDDR